MKFTGLIAIVFAILALTMAFGCANKTVPATPTDTTGKEKPVAPDIKPEEKMEQKKQMPAEVQKLIDATSKVQSMKYLLDMTVNGVVQGKNDIYYVRGDKMKIKKYDPLTTEQNEYYDTIYLDHSAKTAFGYCEDKSNARCTDYNKAFVLNYAAVKWEKTPYQWIHSFDYAEVTGHETIENKQTTRIETPDGVKMWANTYSGLPLRVETSNTVVYFKDFALNSLSEKDVTHQFIPT